MSLIKSKTHEDIHPSFDIVKSHSSKLAGKKIVLCVTGSVAAYKAACTNECGMEQSHLCKISSPLF